MKKINSFILHIQKGVTMLEMLLVLSVIGILLLLATRYYETTHYSSQINEVLKSIQALYAAEQQYCNDNDCSTMPSIILNHNFLPTSFGNPGTPNPWGTIKDGTAPPQGYTYSAIYSEVPATACTTLQNIIIANYASGDIQISSKCPSSGTINMQVDFQ